MGLFRRKKPKYVEEILEYDEQERLKPEPPAGKKEPKAKEAEEKNLAREYCEQILNARV